MPPFARRAGRALRHATFALVLALAPLAGRAAADNTDIEVHVERDGTAVLVTVMCPVAAPRAVVWEVLTDYDHMTAFVSNLTQSTVRMRVGDRLQVVQKGRAGRSPLAFDFENVREVDLTPQTEIRSRIVSGAPMPAEFTTRIEPRGATLAIVHAGRYTPGLWVPPVVGPALIEAETRRQYGEIRDEILRRATRR